MFTFLTLVVLAGLLALVAVQGKLTLRGRNPLTDARTWRRMFVETVGAIPYDLVSKEAQRALEEFREDFMMALTQGSTEQWARTHGLFVPTKAIRTTFPIPVDAAGYNEFKGDVKYRSLYQKSLDLKTKLWQDGVAELSSIVEAPDFIGWGAAPQAMAAAALTVGNKVIRDLLESGGGAGPTCWDGVTFFHDAHPVNIFDSGAGTYDNNITGATTNLSVTSLRDAKEKFRKRKAPNGDPLGLRMTHMLVPPALEETAKDILEQDMLIQSLDGGSTFGAVDNRHRGTVKMVIADELTSDAVWYPMALNKPGMVPWVLVGQDTAEIRLLGKDSALYEKEFKVGVDGILTINGGVALPQCIMRYQGT